MPSDQARIYDFLRDIQMSAGKSAVETSKKGVAHMQREIQEVRQALKKTGPGMVRKVQDLLQHPDERSWDPLAKVLASVESFAYWTFYQEALEWLVSSSEEAQKSASCHGKSLSACRNLAQRYLDSLQ